MPDLVKSRDLIEPDDNIQRVNEGSNPVGALYSARFAFNDRYREHAWIQAHYNRSYLNDVIIPTFRALLARLPDDRNCVYLTDICCGDGLTTSRVYNELHSIAAASGKRLVMTGLDIAPKQIEKAQGLMAELRDHSGASVDTLSFVCTSVESYRPVIKSDMVICLFGLHLLEKNFKKTFSQICKHIGQEEAEFIAIYPLRVETLFHARSTVSKYPTWQQAFKEAIRFIATDNESYRRALSACTDNLSTNMQTHVFTVSKDNFKKFFQSWAPEARGLLHDGYTFDDYFEFLWQHIEANPTEWGSISSDGASITFKDRIQTASLRMRLAEPRLSYGDSRRFVGSCPPRPDAEIVVSPPSPEFFK